MIVFILIIIGIFVFAALMPKSKTKATKKSAGNDSQLRTPEIELPYEKRPKLVTPAELSFMKVLSLAMNDEVKIMAQVRLADIISVKKGLDKSSRHTAFNRIKSKHIDFVLCDPDDYTIFCAIELDDKSHHRADRIKRDEFVTSAMKAANVTFHRFPAQASYSIDKIRETIIGKPAPAKDAPAPEHAYLPKEPNL